MLANETLYRASRTRRAFEIEREARRQDLHFAQLRARFQEEVASRRQSSLIRRTALLLKTFFLKF